MSTTVPTFDRFIEPLLGYLVTQEEPVRTLVACDGVAAAMGLTDSQKAEMLPSGRQAYYRNRIGWAHDRLKRAGLSTSPKRGFWQLTEAGRVFAATHAAGVPPALVAQMAFKPSKEHLGDEDMNELAASSVEALDETLTPEERLEAAYREIRERVRGELLELARQSDPAFFEKLVLDVLHAMGYGATRDALAQTGGPGDGGIDGVITLDRLGLEKVYVQAKRYAETSPITRPTIQAFFGALAGRRATKGVFITTSRFSKEARDFAASASDSIVLVDGVQLADLMIDFRVGVTHRETYSVIDVDNDYFDNE